jgi:hypothetical protein
MFIQTNGLDQTFEAQLETEGGSNAEVWRRDNGARHVQSGANVSRFAAIAGPPCIVDRARYLRAPEEPKWDPKRLWRIRLNPPPVRKLAPKTLGRIDP